MKIKKERKKERKEKENDCLWENCCAVPKPRCIFNCRLKEFTKPASVSADSTSEMRPKRAERPVHKKASQVKRKECAVTVKKVMFVGRMTA